MISAVPPAAPPAGRWPWHRRRWGSSRARRPTWPRRTCAGPGGRHVAHVAAVLLIVARRNPVSRPVILPGSPGHALSPSAQAAGKGPLARQGGHTYGAPCSRIVWRWYWDAFLRIKHRCVYISCMHARWCETHAHIKTLVSTQGPPLACAPPRRQWHVQPLSLDSWTEPRHPGIVEKRLRKLARKLGRSCC